ncbi:MAG: nucleoside recognition domain-containing protein [Oscillospiraceae bacterium]
MRLTDLRQKVMDFLYCAGLLSITVGLIIFPSQMVEAAKSGVELCFNVIIPSLFPFFVISSLCVELGIAQMLGSLLAPVMKPLFNVGGACASALVLGFIGGYPVGARTVINLYNNGECSKSEAERMLSFCNNSGPAFIFGVVGAGIFSSGKIGLILYLAHMAASIMIGILFRKWGADDITECREPQRKARVSFPNAFVNSVSSSFTSSLGICGFVIFFTVLIKLLFLSGALGRLAQIIGGVFGVFGMDAQWAERLLTGILELTSGVWSLRDVSRELTSSIAMAAFMLGWAGLSVHCQVLSFIGSTGISVKTYIIGKLLHGVLSAGLVYLLSRIISFDTPVALYLAEQVSDIAGLNFLSALCLSAASAAGLWLFFMIAALLSSKRGGKSHKKAL